MVYIKYGDTFRKLREQLDLSLSSFSSVGISKTTLSNFERGGAMMSFDKVVVALQFMGISLAEFESFLNNYSPNESDSLLEDIEGAVIAQDTNDLKILYQRAKNEGYQYIALAAKASWSSLNEREIEKVLDLLYNTNIWGYKELCVCYLTMNNFSTRDILSILDTFLIDGHRLFNSKQYQGYLVQVCCRAITILSSRGYKEYAEHILNRMDKYELANTMFHRNLRNVTKGYWLYCFVDTEKGDQMMLQALKIFSELANPETATYYQARYDLLVKNR